MKELSTEMTMTVKEVAEVLNVAENTVLKAVKNLYSDIVKNGKTTYLSEYQVTRIKEQIFKNVQLANPREVTTELEMSEMTIKVMTYHAEKISTLQAENMQLNNTVNMLIHDNKTYTTTEIAKELNLRSGTVLNKTLEEKGLQYKVNNSWVLTAKYSDLNYVSLKQQELDNGKIIYNRHWTGIGRKFILDLFKKEV